MNNNFYYQSKDLCRILGNDEFQIFILNEKKDHFHILFVSFIDGIRPIHDPYFPDEYRDDEYKAIKIENVKSIKQGMLELGRILFSNNDLEFYHERFYLGKESLELVAMLTNQDLTEYHIDSFDDFVRIGMFENHEITIIE